MLRKLTEKDRMMTMGFLKQEPSINLFIIGDIENNGFDKDYQTLWGMFDEKGAIYSVLLKYYDSFIIYSAKEDSDITAFKDIILSFEGNRVISGSKTVIDKLKSFFPELKLKRYLFCEILDADNLIVSDEPEVKTALPDDAERLCALLKEIDEFETEIPAERIAKEIKDGTKRAYFIENREGEMLTVCQTAAENSISAMVVGVATRKDSRRRGLMSACLSKLCADVLSEGKTLCLFYDNPQAGSVYHRLGFKRIEDWIMLR